VNGSGFYSPHNGEILASVDGQPAPTSCPTQHVCRVTIPQLRGHPSTVELIVTTDTGSSNPVSFDYT
jgi:hypothetical protein